MWVNMMATPTLTGETDSRKAEGGTRISKYLKKSLFAIDRLITIKIRAKEEGVSKKSVSGGLPQTLDISKSR